MAAYVETLKFSRPSGLYARLNALNLQGSVSCTSISDREVLKINLQGTKEQIELVRREVNQTEVQHGSV